MKIFKELKKLGYKHYTEHTIEELDNLPLNSEERIMEQGLVLRWFREKHNIYAIILPSYTDDKVVKDKFFYEIANGRKLNQELNYHNTYEEAQDACLDKLIELVKNDNTNK